MRLNVTIYFFIELLYKHIKYTWKNGNEMAMGILGQGFMQNTQNKSRLCKGVLRRLIEKNKFMESRAEVLF